MTVQTQVIRLDPDGPEGTGLQPLRLDPEDFQSPLPVQNLHEYFGDKDGGLSVGVWDTTTMQEAFGPYPGDEFIVVLEGSFEMLDGKGGAVAARAGDSVSFRNGIPTSWKQDGYLKKFYLTWRDSKARDPGITSADGGVTVVTRPPLSGGVVFCNDTGNMTVTYFAPEVLTQALTTTDAHELLQVLGGEVQIAEISGAVQTFAAGDVAFIPKGTVCAWTAPRGFSAWRVRLVLPVAVA